MGTFMWKETYSVGVTAMDEQHKKLVGIIDSLNDAMAAGKGREVLDQVLDEMVEYTLKHFLSEEKLLDKNGFPGLAEQKKEHEAFVQKVYEMRKQTKTNSLSASIEISEFLRKWLTDHILGMDKKYGPYLNNKGVI